MLTLKLSLEPEGCLELQQDKTGKVYELIDYWDHTQKYITAFNYNGVEHKIEYAFAPQSFLNYIKGEKEFFGAYLGDMMFINSSMLKNHPEWIPLILVKLYAQKKIDPGLDKTGRAVHWDSFYRTIRTAGKAMSETQLKEFIDMTRKYESTGYFDLDSDIKQFIESSGNDSLAAKRNYLNRHHNNMWVTRSRNEEVLAEEGFQTIFRSHAEAILRQFSGVDTTILYDTAAFIHEMTHADPDVSIRITPPYTAIAYELTKERNGVVDLIKFQPISNRENNDDIIFKVPKREKTWIALSKRISYNIHKLEQGVNSLVNAERKRLEGLIIEAETTQNHLNVQLQDIRSLLVISSPLSNVTKMLSAHGEKYHIEMTRLEAMIQTEVKTLSDLEEISKLLRSQI